MLALVGGCSGQAIRNSDPAPASASPSPSPPAAVSAVGEPSPGEPAPGEPAPGEPGSGEPGGEPTHGNPNPEEPAQVAAAATPQFLTTNPFPSHAFLAAHRILQAKGRRLVVPADPVAVDLYTLDNRCETYQAEPIQVPRPQSMEGTVALILAEQTIPDLTLSGYRATYDLETKTVTIDLRVARDSRRVLQSLSVCEQKALLGSLKETLIHQPDWNIETVIFTNRGNPLVL